MTPTATVTGTHWSTLTSQLKILVSLLDPSGL